MATFTVNTSVTEFIPSEAVTVMVMKPTLAAVGLPEKVWVAGSKLSQAVSGLFAGGISQGAAVGVGEGVGREGVGEVDVEGGGLVGDGGGDGGCLVEKSGWGRGRRGGLV